MYKYVLACFSQLLLRKNLLRSKSVWTSDKVIVSPFNDVHIPDVTLTEYIWIKRNLWSKKTAVVCGVTDRNYTYDQIHNQSQKLGANLNKKFNIKDGDTVAIISPNIPEYPIIVMGILAAGGVVTTINPQYTVNEVKNIILLSETKVIVAYPEIVTIVAEALKLSKRNIPIIVMDVEKNRTDGTVSYRELIANDIDLDILKYVKRDTNDIAYLCFSSGTTGLPKGVQLSHRNIISNCEQQNTELRHYNYTTDSHQDSVLANAPMYHSYGFLTVMIHKMSAGLKLVTLPAFHPETFVSTLERHKLNLFYIAPPTVMFMGFHPGIKPKHLEHVSCVNVGAAPLPKTHAERLLNKMNNKAHLGQAYGLTETSPVVTISPLGFSNYMCAGLPLPNIKLRVVDSEMNNLGPNEIGELLIAGPNVTKGYKNNPEANSEAFVDEWFRSGDLVRVEEDGTVYIVDRLKELIKVKGYPVAPAELENIIKSHKDILDAAVIGVPDSMSGERPKAYVVPKYGSKINDKEIINYVNLKVAPYKRIKEVEFIDNIPKNPSGKILRRNLSK